MEIDGLATVQKIHAILTEAAKGRRILSYSDVMQAIGWSHIHTYQRNVFAYLLKAIANMELGAGHPPLTALVVAKNTGIPSDSFFEFARSEARLRKDETDREYWSREIERVYAFWGGSPATAAA